MMIRSDFSAGTVINVEFSCCPGKKIEFIVADDDYQIAKSQLYKLSYTEEQRFVWVYPSGKLLLGRFLDIKANHSKIEIIHREPSFVPYDPENIPEYDDDE